nr:acetolactate decarboxylase [Methylococcus sp. BF19-07]
MFHPLDHEDHEVFQSSTIGAVMEGVYDGETTYGELAGYGDFGLGTFNALDGEMIAFGGRFFQIKSDGKAYPVPPTAKTPFAVVTLFDPTVRVEWPHPIDWKQFQAAVDKAAPSKNIFYAIQVRAHFDHIRVRTVPRQHKPYPPLVEVARLQPEFEYENLVGTLVGFRFPDYTQGVNVAGYHVHFLDATETVGGHVLDFTLREAEVDIDVTSRFRMTVPECGAFLDADLAKNQDEAIHQAEG